MFLSHEKKKKKIKKKEGVVNVFEWKGINFCDIPSSNNPAT